MSAILNQMSLIKTYLHNKMTFTEALIASGYVLDEDNFDEGCYVKIDGNHRIHCYQEGEDVGEWNYVKMTEDFDVIEEKTFTL